MQIIKSDYLKYHRVILRFFKIKYKLKTDYIDCLLFLYSERYFDKAKWKEYERLLVWDKYRFNQLYRDGWILMFRSANVRKGEAALFKLSRKAVNLVESLYRKLEGEEIPIDYNNSRMFKKKAPYTDKTYTDMIRTMNSYIYNHRKIKGEKLSADGVYD